MDNKILLLNNTTFLGPRYYIVLVTDAHCTLRYSLLLLSFLRLLFFAVFPFSSTFLRTELIFLQLGDEGIDRRSRSQLGKWLLLLFLCIFHSVNSNLSTRTGEKTADRRREKYSSANGSSFHFPRRRRSIRKRGFLGLCLFTHFTPDDDDDDEEGLVQASREEPFISR